MREYSQRELDDLVVCPKVVVEPPRKDMRQDGKHLRNDFRLQSKDGNLDFSVFIRVHAELPENFSIGLVYCPRDDRDSLCLLRYNGPHGPFGPGVPQHHIVAHIHKATANNITQGRKPEAGAASTEKYASSHQDALEAFLVDIRMAGKDINTHFPGASQQQLFETRGGDGDS